ncbi:HutD/Ves family protein [Rhodanobacter lindaniclasticus]
MIIRLADCPLQPWKNGLGRTRELAVQTSADGGGFDWRISIAEVDSAAPFSSFPGIDRQIVLLDGAGFTMTLDDGRVHALTTPFEPFAFPGEARVQVTLAGGPTRDFNLMLRRGRVRGGIEVWRNAGAQPIDDACKLVYGAHGTIDCADGTLQPGDAWRPRPDGCALSLRPGALALAVRIESGD